MQLMDNHKAASKIDGGRRPSMHAFRASKMVERKYVVR